MNIQLVKILIGEILNDEEGKKQVAIQQVLSKSFVFKIKFALQISGKI